jgi:hypothetical protein
LIIEPPKITKIRKKKWQPSIGRWRENGNHRKKDLAPKKIIITFDN